MSGEKLSTSAGTTNTVANIKKIIDPEQHNTEDNGKNRWARIAVECNSIINRKSQSIEKNCPITKSLSDECENIIFPSTTIVKTYRMDSIARTKPTTATTITTTFTMPSIAVTATTETSASTSSLSKIGGCGKQRSAKIDFVRFDSVETIYRHTDHDEIMQRATIKDEIKR